MKTNCKCLLLLSALMLLLQGCQSPAPQTSGAMAGIQQSPQDPGFIKNSRQITFVGPRAGEGYFSADGKEMVFQAEREEGNPFYQIYLMNLASGETRRVSPGQGKTTCAWIHPDGQKVLFASTHLDPKLAEKKKEELEVRQRGEKPKYSWSYDEQYDLFAYDRRGRPLQRLTKELGYDAEGSYSPDGQWIAFASNRRGYTDKLPPEEAKIFAQDPSYMMDIYLMRADGTQVRQLTDVRGYDGGPFFSADGKKITWRRFAPTGKSAEIFVMNVDGSEQKQVTRLNAMSWAPYFHPSGEYLIFTSNILGYNNFELFIVDVAGEKEPVRVSHIDGFDGLPVFSPDGRKLSWTHRNEKGESQIYLADWDDALARKMLGLPQRGEKAISPKAAPVAAEPRGVGSLRAWVEYFAAPEMQGRMTGSSEEKLYGEKIAQSFRELGLVPAVGDSYFQNFSFTSDVRLGPKNSLVVSGAASSTAVPREDYLPLALSQVGETQAAPVVFAGYGIVAPASDKQPAYDSYGDLDVKGKWVLALRDLPEDVSIERRFHLNIYARIHHKAMVARNRGALGLILVERPGAKKLKLMTESAANGAGIPVVVVTDAWAQRLFTLARTSLKDQRKKLDQGESGGEVLPGVQIAASVDLEYVKTEGRNILARLKVPGAKGAILIGAHGDHLGHGERGDSLARDNEKGQIHAGADDNASGMAGVMVLAKQFSDAVKAGSSGLKRDLIFAIWSGEELGVLGSSHFVKSGGAKNIQAYLNMDMIGRYRDRLMIQGVGSAKEWPGVFERLAAQTPLALTLQEDPYLPTDAMALYLADMPVASFFTGAHAEYHSPRDLPGTLNYDGLGQTVDLVGKTVAVLASSANPLVTYRKVEGNQSPMRGRGFRLYLGTIPDYSQEGVKGVRISGTSKSSPAEKAGLKAGDIIVELGSQKIQNLYDYVYCLQSMKANEPTTVRVMREGRVVELVITPALKE